MATVAGDNSFKKLGREGMEREGARCWLCHVGKHEEGLQQQVASSYRGRAVKQLWLLVTALP